MPDPIRTCARCGQPVNIRTDSFQTVQPGAKMQHITCPISPALTTLPPARAAELAEGLTAHGATPPRPVFLRMKDAQELLHVSESTLRRLIRSGRLPAKRLPGGQTVLIEQAHLLGLLEDANDI